MNSKLRNFRNPVELLGADVLGQQMDMRLTLRSLKFALMDRLFMSLDRYTKNKLTNHELYLRAATTHCFSHILRRPF